MAIQWSHSVDWVLRKCGRRFWFQYIFADPRARWGSVERETYILSNVQTLEQWRGSLVHSVIQDYVIPALKQEIIPQQNDLHEYAINFAREQIRFSQRRRYRTRGMTKSRANGLYTVIWEDEFPTTASKLDKKGAWEESNLALTNLLQLTPLLEKLTTSNWIEAEASIELGNFNIPVKGRADLILANEEKQSLTLIDWKIGHSVQHDYAPQLWLYAYLLEQVDSYQDSNYKKQDFPEWIKSLSIHPLEVNLLQGTISEYDWNNKLRLQVQDRIFRGVRQINAILDGRNLNDIDPKELPITDNPNNCNYCPFRKPCQEL